MNPSLLKETIEYQISLVMCEARTGFDIRKFKSLETEEQRAEYAHSKLQRLGKGSSREVFLLSNRFVLKLALGTVGQGQNQAEVDVFTNPYIKPIVAKIYDFGSNYEWLISEAVRTCKLREFINYFGVEDEYQLRRALNILASKTEYQKESRLEAFVLDYGKNAAKEILSTPQIQAVGQLMRETGVVPGDLFISHHWGKTTDGRLVILDYGLTDEVYDQFYR